MSYLQIGIMNFNVVTVKMRKISIVIVTWNSQDVIEQCISSLIEHLKSQTYEIILVDNFSKDPSYLNKFSKNENVHLIYNTDNLGFSKAVNIGLKHAIGDYFLILNPDILFVSDPFPRLFHELESNPQIGVIGPLLIGNDGQPQIENYYLKFPSLLQFLVYRSVFSKLHFLQRFGRSFIYPRLGKSGINFIDQIPGAFFLFSKHLFGNENVFTEDYFIWMEDVDFCLRVKNKGLKTVVVLDEKVTHLGGASFKIWNVTSKKLMFIQSYLTYLNLRFNFPAYLCHLSLMIFNSLCLLSLSPIFHFRDGFGKISANWKVEKQVFHLILQAFLKRLSITLSL